MGFQRLKYSLTGNGGEQVLEADMAILDEIDSGLDIDALRDVATAVVGLKKDDNAVLMITHYQRLLDYIEPTFVHIMVRRTFQYVCRAAVC